MRFHLPCIPSATNRDLADQMHDIVKHFKNEKESEAHQVIIGLISWHP